MAETLYHFHDDTLMVILIFQFLNMWLWWLWWWLWRWWLWKELQSTVVIMELWDDLEQGARVGDGVVVGGEGGGCWGGQGLDLHVSGCVRVLLCCLICCLLWSLVLIKFMLFCLASFQLFLALVSRVGERQPTKQKTIERRWLKSLQSVSTFNVDVHSRWEILLSEAIFSSPNDAIVIEYNHTFSFGKLKTVTPFFATTEIFCNLAWKAKAFGEKPKLNWTNIKRHKWQETTNMVCRRIWYIQSFKLLAFNFSL